MMQLRRNNVVNRGCLQKPHAQTHSNKPGYFPHMRITAAERDRNNEDGYYDAEGNYHAYYEGARSLRRFIASEEAEIDSHFTTKYRL